MRLLISILSIITVFGQATDYYQIMSTGQSLAIGGLGSPALSTTQPYTNVMLTGGTGGVGTVVPLISLLENTVETPGSGLANSLYSYFNDSTKSFAVANHAAGGTAYAGIAKGTAPYTKGQTQASTTKSYVISTLGKTYHPYAVTIVHGETDYANGLSSTYEANMVQFQSDYQSDMNTLVGTSGVLLPFFMTQMNAGATGEMAQAQWQAALDNPGKIIMVGPKYQFTYVTGGLHLNNTSYRNLGELYAKVMHKVIDQGQTWKALSPQSISIAANVITIAFNIPVPPLVLDTTIVVDRPSHGFQFTQTGGNTVTISSVSVGASTVQITLSATPTGTNQTVKYAWDGINKSPGNLGCGNPLDATFCGGNIRDSDSSVSPASDGSGLPLYNWLVTFSEPVEFGANSGMTGTVQASGSIQFH